MACKLAKSSGVSLLSLPNRSSRGNVRINQSRELAPLSKQGRKLFIVSSFMFPPSCHHQPRGVPSRRLLPKPVLPTGSLEATEATEPVGLCLLRTGTGLALGGKGRGSGREGAGQTALHNQSVRPRIETRALVTRVSVSRKILPSGFKSTMLSALPIGLLSTKLAFSGTQLVSAWHRVEPTASRA